MKAGKALIESVDRCRPGSGNLSFWWIGQLSFIVKVEDIVLYFDPFLSDQPGRVIPPPLRPEEVNAGYVFGSHDHADHIDRPAWPVIAVASPGCRFVVPEMLAENLSADLGIPAGRFAGVDAGVTYRDQRVTVYGVPAAHERLDADPATGRHPYMGFVVEAGGLRIYHSGDCCVYDGLESALRSFGRIDLMMLPINGRDGYRLRHGCIGNMSFMEAADLAGALEPGLVIPSHYEMFEGNRFLTEAMMFAEFMEAKYPAQRFWIGAHAERVDLKTDG